MNKKLLALTLVSLLLAGCSQKTAEVEQETKQAVVNLSPEPTLDSGDETIEEIFSQDEDIKILIPTAKPMLSQVPKKETSLEDELNELDKQISSGTGTDNLTEADFLF